MIAPEKFMYFGMAGSFTNWQQLGQWEYDKALKPVTVQDISTGNQSLTLNRLTAGITDPIAKG